MALKGKKILAIVPARGGSKGIHRKNLRKIAGKSLVKLAAEYCKKFDFIDYSIISTDDNEIISEAIDSGLSAPFVRPIELSSDIATAKEVWIHAWKESESKLGFKFDISILIEPTSPLRIKEDLIKSINLLLEGKDTGCTATVSRIPGNLTPYKTHIANDDGFLSYYFEKAQDFPNRQSIPPFYFRNGLCYSAKRSHLIESNKLFESNCKMVMTERPVINIDDEYEIEIAEYFLSKYK